MDPVLAEIDRLLDDEELYQLIRNDLAKRFPQTEVTAGTRRRWKYPTHAGDQAIVSVEL